MEQVLVTGGSGFVGGWCVVELLRQGYRVRTTVRDISREGEVRTMIASQVDPDGRLAVVAADLTEDAGWEEAVEGCDYVLHVASPFPPAQPKDPDELIVPARDGTLRVLRTGLAAGARRVVVTSSIAAISGAAETAGPGPLTEEHWTDPDAPGRTPYVRSKAVAERAAWDLVQSTDAVDRLATIAPGAILGPVLGSDLSYSLEIVERMLKGMPGLPRLGFNFVDVRDVADLHVRAMTAPEAGGERFIGTGPFAWLAEIAEILRDRLGPAAAKVPKRRIPNVAVRAMSLIDPGIRSIVGDLDRKVTYSADKARERLGWTPRPLADSVVDCAESLIARGLVPAAGHTEG